MTDEEFDAKENARYKRLSTLVKNVVKRFNDEVNLYLHSQVFTLDERQTLYQYFKDDLDIMVCDLERPRE